MEFSEGMNVIWLKQERGGYGYTSHVPARVIGHTKWLTIIAAKLADGTEKTVRVKSKHLRCS